MRPFLLEPPERNNISSLNNVHGWLVLGSKKCTSLAGFEVPPDSNNSTNPDDTHHEHDVKAWLWAFDDDNSTVTIYDTHDGNRSLVEGAGFCPGAYPDSSCPEAGVTLRHDSVVYLVALPDDSLFVAQVQPDNVESQQCRHLAQDSCARYGTSGRALVLA